MQRSICQRSDLTFVTPACFQRQSSGSRAHSRISTSELPSRKDSLNPKTRVYDPHRGSGLRTCCELLTPPQQQGKGVLAQAVRQAVTDRAAAAAGGWSMSQVKAQLVWQATRAHRSGRQLSPVRADGEAAQLALLEHLLLTPTIV